MDVVTKEQVKIMHELGVEYRGLFEETSVKVLTHASAGLTHQAFAQAYCSHMDEKALTDNFPGTTFSQKVIVFSLSSSYGSKINFYYDARMYDGSLCANFAPLSRLPTNSAASLIGTLCEHKSLKNCLKDIGGPLVCACSC
jgi:hypothetical protein